MSIKAWPRGNGCDIRVQITFGREEGDLETVVLGYAETWEPGDLSEPSSGGCAFFERATDEAGNVLALTAEEEQEAERALQAELEASEE